MATRHGNDGHLLVSISAHAGLELLLEHFGGDLQRAADRADALRKDLHAADTRRWHPVQQERKRR